MNTLGVGIVGCGERGAVDAAAALKAPHTSLAMVMDKREVLAQQLGERTNTPWTTSYDDLLANPEVDVVFLITPHFLHAEQAIQAAEAGKHVIVAKPMATRLDEAVLMAEAALRNEVVLSVCLTQRYIPYVGKAKELIEAGALGTIQGGQVTHQLYKPRSYYTQGHKGLVTDDWRSKRESSGGGVLIMNGIHTLDVFLYVCSLKVVEVSARYETFLSSSEVEDTIVMWLRLENNALVTVNISACVRGLVAYEHGIANGELADIRLWGTDGHLSFAPPYQFYSSRKVDSQKPGRWNLLKDLPNYHKDCEVEYLNRFAKAVLEGRTPEVSVEDGLRIQAIIEAAYQSADSGQAVPVHYPDLIVKQEQVV